MYTQCAWVPGCRSGRFSRWTRDTPGGSGGGHLPTVAGWGPWIGIKRHQAIGDLRRRDVTRSPSHPTSGDSSPRSSVAVQGREIDLQLMPGQFSPDTPVDFGRFLKRRPKRDEQQC